MDINMFFFFTPKVTAATDLHFRNNQGPRFQLKIFCSAEVSYILNGLRVRKLTANVHFYSFTIIAV